MAKEMKRLCHHIAHTSATASRENVCVQECCALLLVPPSPFPRSFSEHSLALFLPHALVPVECQGKDEPPVWDQEGLGQQGKVLQWTGGEDVLQPP